MRAIPPFPACLATSLALLMAVSATAAQEPDLDDPGTTTPETAREPLTRAERSGFTETTRYDEVVEILERLADGSERIALTWFGYTMQGRPLPLAIAGAGDDASPTALRGDRRLRIYLQGNIHAGEVCGKEALLILLRELAAGAHAGWDDDAVLLVAPIYNADGNERIRLDNRPRQNGPVGGMGQRANAQGLDLNRDHMKAEAPETRSLLRLLRDWDPHLAVDLHTTNGTRHAYHLTYAPPLHPNTHASIDELLRDAFLPAVQATMEADHGWLTHDYGNLPWRQDVPRGWYTFDHRPRFGTNYVGLRNRLAILSEAYAYAGFEERVRASRDLVAEIVDFAVANRHAVREAVDDAVAASVVGRELGVRAEHEVSDEDAEILMGEVELDRHPHTGRPLLRRLDVVRPERMPELVGFRSTDTEVAPLAYLLPPELDGVIDLLAAHGIEARPLPTHVSLDLERFRITGSTAAEREFQGHRERRVEGAWEPTTLEVPAGTLRVDLDQPLGRLAFSLLEPRSDDGIVDWNFVDDEIADGLYPVLRIAAPPR